MSKPTRILIVEDFAADVELAKREIRKVAKDCKFQHVETREEYVAALETFQPDLILSDYHLPHFDGMEALRLVMEYSQMTPLIIWTGSLSEDIAVDCMKAGANNYIIKENIKRLGPAVIHALEERRLLLERRQAEEKYQAIFENSPEGIFQSTPDGRYLSVNPALARIYGYDSPEEMIESVTDILHQIYVEPDERSEFIQVLQTKGVIENFERKNFRRDGSMIWTSTSARVVRDVGGNILYYEGFLQDVTERRQVEEALENNEKRFRALIENGLDNISLLAADGTLIWESPAVFRTLDYAPDEFLGQDIFKLMHPDDLEWTRSLYANILQEPGSRQSGSFRLRHSSGTWRWVEAIVTNMLNEPSVNAIVVNYRDITERKQAEKALLESEQRYRALFEHTPVAIWEEDFSQVKKHLESLKQQGITDFRSYFATHPDAVLECAGLIRILDVNNTAVKMYQAESKEQLIKSANQGLSQGESEHIDEVFIDIAEGKTSNSWEGADETLTGKPIEISLSWSNAPGHEVDFSKVIVTTLDITESKRAEAQVRDLLVFNEKILNGSPIGILTYKLTGDCVFANQNAASIIGASVEKLEAQNFHSIESWKKSGLYHLAEKAITSRVPVTSDIHHLSTFGKDVWLTAHVVTFKSKDEDHLLVTISDITERKQAEEALRQSENRYRSVVEIQTEFIVRWKPGGIRTFANEAYCRYFWLSPEEAISGSFLSLIHEQDRPKVEEKINRLILGVTRTETDIHRIIKPDGSIGWQEWTDQAIYNDRGILVEFQSVGRDVTEREQAAIERRALLEIMQGLANTNELQDFLKLIHLSIGRVIYAENFFVVLYDESSGLFEEIYSVDQYDPPEPPSKLEKSITSYVFRTSEPLLLTDILFREMVVRGEVELVGTNSESWLGVPLKTAGRTIGVLAVQDYENPDRYTERDKDFLASIAAQVALAIERKRADELLRESEERFASAFEYASIGIALVAPDGRWLRVNQALCELLGYSEEELLAKTFQDITHPEDLEADLDYVRQVLAGERRSFQMEKRYFHKSGDVIWVLLSVSLVRDNKGMPQHFISQIQDITERKRAEDASQKSEQRYRALFEDTPISIWEEDFSAVKNHLDSLKKQGIMDLRAYFTAHPEALFECAALIRIVDVNNAAMKMYWADSKEQLIQSTIQVLSQGKQEHNLDDFIAIADGKLSNSWEGADKTLTGEPVEISLKWSVAPGHAEDFSKVIVTVIDITERKRAEESLKKAEEKYRDLVERLPLVIYTSELGINGAWSYVSPQLEELLGFTPQEWMADPTIWHRQVHTEDFDRQEKIEEEAHAMGKRFESEYRIFTKDGRQLWIRDSAQILPPQNGGAPIVQGVLMDVTGRKHVEAERERLSNILEASLNEIYIFDANTLRFQYVNAGAQRNLGYSFEQLEALTPLDLKPEFTAASFHELLAPLLQREQEIIVFETVHRRADGSLYPVEVHLQLVERDGERIFLAIISDTTERKRAEKAIMRHLAELEALYENGLAVGRLLKPGEIGDRIIETFARYLSWHHVAIRLKRPESDDLELIALNQPGLNEQERAEMERHFNSMIRKVDQGLSGWVIQTGEAIRTGNVHTHPQYVDTQEGIQSGLYMPLRIGDRIIGSISVESEAADAFTSQDERLLATLSNQAAIAFENARLYQSAQQELAERKRLQEQLDREHAQLKALFETIPDPIWLKDPQGKYLACNPVLEELIDIPEAQILGKTDYDLLDKKLAEHFKARDQEAIDRDVPMTYQEWVTYPNKLPRLMETVRTPMHDDRGSLIGVLGISHDITAMHNTQQELRESQELYRLLVETSPDGIGILGLDGTIIFANQQLADMFEMKSPFDCIGTNFLSLVAPEHHAHITSLMGELVPDGISLEEYRMVRKDGTRFDGETRFSLSLDKAGQPRWIIGQIRDITESKTARETIQEERQRFLELFENTPVAIWLEDFSAVVAWMEQLRIRGVTDLKEYVTRNPDQLNYGLGLIRILSVNQAAVEMHGAHSKAHLLENFYQLVRAGSPSGAMMDELDLLWKGKTSFEFEMTIRKLDDTLSTGILHVYIPVNNGKPDYGRVIIASTDISERVNTEKALQASETHYRELADSITDIFFEMDSNLHYIHWNKSSEVLTGILAKDAIGKSMREIFGETEEQARIEKIYEDVLSNHQSKTFETSLALGNHQYVFEINAYPSTRGVSVVAKDVTDRKRSETIMQKRFELMEYSAQHSLNEVMQKTIDEVSQLTGSSIGFMHFVEADEITLGMQTWSTSALQQFSVPISEGVHLSVDRAGVWADAVRRRRSLIQNDYDSLPDKKRLPEGHASIIREMVIPIIRNEKTVAVLGLGNRPTDYTQRDLEVAERFADYAWDITERKQMEVALADERNQLAKRVEERAADLIRANTNLARALRVKDEFLANMSHELRTPLNAILGLSESLGEQIAGPLNEKQQKYITTISESGRHLLSLINDILDLAKIEAGQITLDINRVDIQSVCEASLRMIRQLAQNKRQEVTLEIDDDIGLIWADERRLKQMMVNLLSNAVKFTPEDGKIGLEIHGNKNENEVMITVWDNGIGMKEEDLSRLFQPFVQLDSGLARETTGTGLGLALVAQMVRLHGGSVRVDSHPEQGSRFTIVLPWEPALAIDTASKMKVTGKFRAVNLDSINRPTVLLIEDTNEVIMMIRDYLELAGYQVVTARDGVEGITQAQLVHPDLILMDVMMPRMDGLEATRRLRSEPEFEATPIIALTALAMPSDRERCISAGMNDYMSKPVNLKELVKTIQRFLPDTEESAPR